MRDRAKAPALLVAAANLFATPLYWLELMVVADRVATNPTIAMFLALIGSVAIACALVWTWMRNPQMGAVVQLLALALPVARVVRDKRPTLSAFAWADLTDLRFGLALLLLVVVPAVLLSVSVVVLKRRQRRDSS